MESGAESLRSLSNIFDRDIRNNISLEKHHEIISRYSLIESVPEKITIQFETAKNIYLYAWNVYRFFNVADHQALTCLELALRVRFKDDIPKSDYPRTENPMLWVLLRYAISHKHIKNEGFSAWHEIATTRAQSRYMYEQINFMSDNGIESLEVDYSNVVIMDEDKDFDYIHEIKRGLINSRNDYAHGSFRLDKAALGTIKLVSEMINQIYNDFQDK